MLWDERQTARACRVLCRMAGWRDEQELWTLDGPTERALAFYRGTARLAEEEPSTRVALAVCVYLHRRAATLDLDDLFDPSLEPDFVDALLGLVAAHRAGPKSIERWLARHGDDEPQVIEDDSSDSVIDYDQAVDGRFPITLQWGEPGGWGRHTRQMRPRESRQELLDEIREMVLPKMRLRRGRPRVDMELHIGAGFTKARAYSRLLIAADETIESVFARIESLV